VAQRIVSAIPNELLKGGLTAADPAVGDGELLAALLRSLPQEILSDTSVYGFETDPGALALAQRRLTEAFPQVSQSLQVMDFLEHVTEQVNEETGPSLFSTGAGPGRFDLVIANPPYVRTQVLGAGVAQGIAGKFGLGGRVDLYFPFLLGIAALLKPGGVAGVIVSNRFMTTRAGADVREALLKRFEVLHVWDLGDTKLFEASVLPAVLLLRRAQAGSDVPQSRFTSIYSAPDSGPGKEVDDVFLALNETGPVEVASAGRFHVRQGLLESNDVWRVQDDSADELLSKAKERTHSTFGQVGNVRVGVKTTADDVFVRNDWQTLPPELRPELLRPLTTHHSARPFKPLAVIPEWQILYTHTVEQGKRVAIDITKYPRTSAYLAQFKEKLTSRRYVIEAGRRWYEIWVPQDPSSWPRPKVVLRDIAEDPVFWLDEEGTVVNGDCYWIEPRPGVSDDTLWLLLAVGNSSFATAFYDHAFNNRLYSSRRRFMTQYVEHFPIPNPQSSISQAIVAAARQAYHVTPSADADRLRGDLDALVWEAFGLAKEVSR
jgi:hypothetical protein